MIAQRMVQVSVCIHIDLIVVIASFASCLRSELSTCISVCVIVYLYAFSPVVPVVGNVEVLMDKHFRMHG